jgi:photosystem II stability/assembly factor-like uncharacterized protein
LRSTALLSLLALLCALCAAQQQQATQPEPGASKSRRARQEKQAENSSTPAAAGAQQAEGEAKGPWKALQYRLVGPFRGGRVVAVSGVVGEPNTYYFGGVAGGVWKTTDGGLNWAPLTDKTKEMSPAIGALAVSESDPNVIYAGTGEACIRGNVVGGNGVYKSADAGKSWRLVGLADTHAVGRIIIDPKNPDRVFVAALGHPFADNEERGIFRTLDGGKTWQKVLYKDAKSGGIDVTFAPSNPNLLFAALWQVRRTPWSLDSGGLGSGLYRSNDGGSTWKELKGHGLPDGPLGRIGVTVSGADPNRVWAIVEAKQGGIYRSDDGGDSWHRLTDDHRFTQRAWYYSHIFADPKSQDTVYVLNTGAYVSHDGGKTFARLRAPHGDNHGLWIDPTNPQRLINGNDGGATISVDGGKTWSTEYNQPTAQFYHVVTDNRFPYYMYGAQQDNSTVGIASASPDGAIDRPDWYDVGGGESGYIAPDPTDPQIVYAGSYGGEITRYDHRTSETQAVNPWPVNPIGWAAADIKHRFQWTEPIVFSPHDPKTLYFAGEVLFKSTNGGMNWTIISPDLTRNDKSKQQSSGGPITKDNTGVEVYDTIFSVVESPVQQGLIWAGSDDGLIHLTRDGGQHWQNVTPKAMPEWGTVSMIEASPTAAGTAYVAVERHKMDDFAPYIFRTTDFGKSWTSLVNGIPNDDYVHAVRVDPRRSSLLFAGTEQGMYVSFDEGAHWQPLQLNLPPSPVNDLVIKNTDLVVATHGRSFWVLDDITPLEQYSDAIAQQEVHLFTPAAASHTIFHPAFFRLGNVGKNPPGGAVIDYWLKTAIKPEEKKKENDEQGTAAPEKPAPKITLEILDASGKVIRKFPPRQEEEESPDEPYGREHEPSKLSADAGLNRFVWDLRYEEATKVPHAPLWGGSTEGPVALPGNYQVRLTVLGKSYTAPLEVKPDPRLKVTQADLQKQFDLLMKIHDKLGETDQTINQIRDLRSQIAGINKRLKDDPRQKPIADAGKALEKKMTGVDVLNFPIRLNNQLAALGGVVGSADSAPTQQSYEVFDLLSSQIDEQLAKWKSIIATDVKSYNDLVRQQDVPALILPKPQAGQ